MAFCNSRSCVSSGVKGGCCIIENEVYTRPVLFTSVPAQSRGGELKGRFVSRVGVDGQEVEMQAGSIIYDIKSFMYGPYSAMRWEKPNRQPFKRMESSKRRDGRERCIKRMGF